MRTLTEMREWIEGAEQEFGDPAIPVGQLFARYFEDGRAVTPETVCAQWRSGELLLAVSIPGCPSIEWLPLSIDVNGPCVNPGTGALEMFGIEEICRGMWSLTPSLNIPGLVHVFVCVYDVPAPSPWERCIITR